MFIHFGLYSELGGVWDDKPVTNGYSEQIQSHAGIFSDVYADVANSFNPQKWNPEEIVQLAKQAGMGAIVITAKHHDGFCMYHSQYTDFNIVDATPYGKDVVKSLSEACKENGLKFGLYFSLVDWHFPEAYPISSHNADPVTPEHHQYNINQVTELLTNYSDISELWFDMGDLTVEQSEELYDLVHTLQPNCMVSSRLGNDCSDFLVMSDNFIPDEYYSLPWQTPASMFDETWGYRSWQQRGDPKDKAIEKFNDLKRIISLGGTYLLNIGPMGNGNVVPFEKQVLTAIGQMIKDDPSCLTPPKINNHDNCTEYAVSYMDYYVQFKSKTAYNKQLTVKKKQQPYICYTESEIGRKICVCHNDICDTIILPKTEDTKNLNNSGVSFEPAFYSDNYRRFYLPKKTNDIIWKAIESTDNEDNNFAKIIKIGKKQSVLTKQLIFATHDCDYLIEVIFTSAFRLQLNGEELAAVKRSNVGEINRMIVRLPLKQGENKLIISYFNRYDKFITFGVSADVEQIMYSYPLTEFPEKKTVTYHFRMTAADRRFGADMELQNIVWKNEK
jgi:hypothetical protein